LVGPDTLLFLGATLVGTGLGLVHLALAVRAFRRGWRLGLVSLLVPTVGAILAARSGAKGAAITWAILGVAYAVLLVLTLV
jgi:hypothetical protein